MRQPIADAKRIVVKVGSSSLTDRKGRLDPKRLLALVGVLAQARAAGREIVLVSSGAIAAGMAPLGLKTKPRDLAGRQAAASVGQGLLIEHYTVQFGAFGVTVGQVLLTNDDVTRQASYTNALRTLTRLLELDVLPIVNENDTVATHEIRFGDNDRLAALVAQMVGAEALIMLSDVDALYTTDPREPGAERIEEVTSLADLDVDTSHAGASVGTGGMATKLDAARIATNAGIDVVVTNAGAVREALEGEPVGTWFHATGKRRSRRLLWLAYASKPRGELVLDAGAVQAVTKRKASLLPAGVIGFSGDFHAGDPVQLVDEAGTVLARGFVNYDASEVPNVIGRSTHDLVAERGEASVMVHRDGLVLRPRD